MARDAFYTTAGYPFTIALDGEFRVYVPDADMMYQAEDMAWDLLESVLPKDNEDFIRCEIDEATDISDAFLAKGYNVRLKVKFVICVVDHDIDDAYYKAVDMVESIDLPNEIMLMGTEQTDLIEVGERILVLHGDDT